MDKWSVNCTGHRMAPDVREADVHGVLERHRVRYEVHPYYVVSELRPVGAPPVDKRVRAGFDVDLFGTVEGMQLPRFQSEEGHTVVQYFEAITRELQSKIG